MSENLPVADGHLCNMGKMIEEIEGKLRNSVEQVNYHQLSSDRNDLLLLPKLTGHFGIFSPTILQVYFGKTREMVCTLRPLPEGLQFKLPDN